MPAPSTRRLLRRCLCLASLCACLAAATSSRLPPAASAGDPNYFYSVTIASEADADSPCWSLYSQGTGCSAASCDDARRLAINDALNNMPSGCGSAPFRVESEYCVEGSACSP